MSGLIGQTIDAYEILGVLGTGGMGIVYKAKDTTLDRVVALKMMDSRFADDETFLKRFQSEARALAKLQHPNIVSIYALRETEQGFFLAMEFVDGVTLADRIRQVGPMPIDATIKIFMQILVALEHAHNAGIIHRDIKPSNIMLATEDLVKVTDFGLAKIQQASAMTMTMGTAGTLYYMSPEQIRGLANVDKRGDIYSLGMTLYEAISGSVPFAEDFTDFSVRKAIVDGDIPALDKVKPDVPKGLSRIVMKAMEKDPEKRYQTAMDMCSALADLDLETVGARPGAGAATVFMPEARPPARSRKGLWIAVVSVILLGIAGLSYGYFTSKSPSGERGGTAETLPESPAKTEPVAGARALLSVETNPADAAVTVNGQDMGTAPMKEFAIPPGTLRIVASRDGFLTKDTTITVAANERASLALALLARASMSDAPVAPKPVQPKREPPREPKAEAPPASTTVGKLAVMLFPSGKVTVDGVSRSADASQAAMFDLAAGTRSITVTHPQYGTKKVSVAIEGKMRSVSYYFEQSITILVKPVFGNISVNGETIGLFSSKVLTKGPGRYTISVMKEGYTVESTMLNGRATGAGPQTITVEPGEQKRDIRVIFSLKEK
ncbi:MAG: protein kinase [Ignavibacteria bacterium]|nr:protein kinase [Ignavibacteria bacterium]